MKVLQALQSLSSYPIPASSIENICEEVGMDSLSDLNIKDRQSSAYKRAKAKVYQFLSEAPNVSQGGISYSFSSDERSRYARKADELMTEVGDPEDDVIKYGYKGEDF
ncbi:MAG: hypothetical protein MJZ26_09100 [Fibrobacter sp.]|nr:hypothetical protein [Fibrobacter sp.]